MKISHLIIAASVSFGMAACTTTQTNETSSESKYSSSKSKGMTGKHAGKSNHSSKKHKGSWRSGGHGKKNFYKSYDADNNKSVTIAEYTAERTKGYAKRDLNNDGNVLADEYVAEYEARLEKDLAEMRDRQLKQAYVRFGVLDKDKNGIISSEEFQAMGMRMFNRMDTNKDKVVNEADVAKRY